MKEEKMNKEIERKYAVKNLPKGLKVEKIIRIKQAFLYRDKLTIVRIRDIRQIYPEVNQEYVYTLKFKGDIEYNNNYDIGKKYEIENAISKEYFEKLIEKPISKIIEKTRIVIPIQNNLKVELDVYYHYLDGLLTAEIEFPDEETFLLEFFIAFMAFKFVLILIFILFLSYYLTSLSFVYDFNILYFS